ncbi:AraC family transcriptional regulator [Roseovarius sp. A46]|uniref:AraC family transcriptional regulator n=1 Tax=Roseovarius sp. A46 TaxID=2109331 RepID=UPI0010106983|nr:AraC family transcriptional regulator [Roseovarius sp. A46]RXV61642.1 AraC family transcriptional regulator [Roseovarius sp. A46]
MDHATVMTLVQWMHGAEWRLTLQHSCPCHALVWMTRGQGVAVVEGVRRGIGVHNALVLPARTMFSLDPGKTGFGLVCEMPAQATAPMPDRPLHMRIRDVMGQNELTAIFEGMQREQNDARPFSEEVVDAQAALMSVWLRRAMLSQPEEPASGAAERLVRAYAALIERHHASTRSMADHARTLGVTPTHLTRVCRRLSGLSAAELLTERSLHAARDLIEASDRPMAQIAAELGFGSAAYFSRFILHHTGRTPSDLRSAARARIASPVATAARQVI